MAEEGQEQNRSEQATPFKLRRARERGMVARGLDLGFVAGLIALAAFVIVAGAGLIRLLAAIMRRTLMAGVQSASDPGAAHALAAESLWPVLRPVALFGITVMAIVLLVEIIQLRGVVFSAYPLKPDFTRLNPAKGLKRVFSVRMLKEALKNILKMIVYAVVVYLVIRAALNGAAERIADAGQLAATLRTASTQLLLVFILLAAFFAVVDQIMARGAFAKQMRMSRRDITREAKEREGDSRQKGKRKQLHAAFVKQAKGLGNLAGSDMLIVNPTHVAVALAYNAEAADAPIVSAKGADRQALQLRAAAHALGVPIFEVPGLARALFRSCDMGDEIRSDTFHAVAELYFKVQEAKRV